MNYDVSLIKTQIHKTKGFMNKDFTLGLGIIHAEQGEVRAFLPDFVSKMSRFFKTVILEDGYGKGLGIESEYYTKSPNVLIGSAEEVYAQNFVLVLRYPPEKYLAMMPPKSCLISMCHFPTRPERRAFLKERGIEAISLDTILDDNGQRLVENLHSVAWNGCEVAFQVLHELNPDIGSAHRPPLRVTILGSGGVGTHAVQAAIRYGDPKIWSEYAANNIPGNIVRVVDYDLTSHQGYLQELLKTTILLIDATQRSDPSQIIVPNSYIALMPKNAVILDLSVDPYDFKQEPHEVKGIEGIPQGDLDQYIFPPDDPAWDQLPVGVDTKVRRWVVSCYSWPGIHPRACMLRYGNQISPLLRRMVAVGGIDKINPGGSFHERALARGMLKYWRE
jgi:alanine dehydrogenase